MVCFLKVLHQKKSTVRNENALHEWNLKCAHNNDQWRGKRSEMMPRPAPMFWEKEVERNKKTAFRTAGNIRARSEAPKHDRRKVIC